MNVQTELTKRFKEIAKQLIKPPVLFGPKWLQTGPAAGQYQFMGAPRIAKATGRSVERVANSILRELTVGDLGLTAKITPSGVITLSPAQAKDAKPKPDEKAQQPEGPADGEGE